MSIRPGSDALLLAAIANVMIADGIADPGAHIGEHLAGLDEFAVAIAPFTPERVADATGVDPSTIRRLAHEIAAAPTAAVYGRIGTTTTEFGSTASWLIDAVNILSGNLDRPGGVDVLHAGGRRPADPRQAGFGAWFLDRPRVDSGVGASRR